MSTIIVKNNNIEFALRRSKVESAPTLSKARERADGYKKPGVRLREEKKINTRNSIKNSKYKNSKSNKNYKYND